MAPESSTPELAAVVLTKNVAQHIVPCIETLRFADRIVVSDSYSTDGTVELARGRCGGDAEAVRQLRGAAERDVGGGGRQMGVLRGCG